MILETKVTACSQHALQKIETGLTCLLSMLEHTLESLSLWSPFPAWVLYYSHHHQVQPHFLNYATILVG